MSTIRIYEFAKQNNMTSKEVLVLAENNGFEFNSHMSSVTQEQQEQLKKLLQNQQTSGKQTKKDVKKTKPVKETNQKIDPSNDAQKSKTLEKAKAATKSSAGTDTHARDRKNTNPKPKSDKEKGKVATKQNKPSGASQPASNKKASQTKASNSTSNDTGGSKRSRGDRRRGRRGKQNTYQKESKGLTARKHKDLPEEFHYTEGMNVQDIAKGFHRDATEIIKKLLLQGVMVNQNQALSKEVIELICIEYGVEPVEKVIVEVSDLDHYFEEAQEDENQTLRPPVVTIMGHVDHGKTSLLDSFRHSRVTEGEAGGITQHIGAYQIVLNNKPITFLDTPGHAAFTTMRARGADVTDITIIVVAADDGVMPQTVEAINHAKAADVPIIVAINKIDKPEANPDKVMTELSEHGIISEAWGGEHIFVNISAKFGTNLDELLEMILLVAEVQELKANPDRLALGSVIEARLDKATGATATLLVQQGTLNIGDPIVVGNTYGRVRTMVNDQGRRIRSAGPSMPVEITGLNDAPQAGDQFVVFEDEKTARQAGEERAQKAQEQQRDLKKKVTLDNLFETLQEGELRSVNVILKADVQGSVEALAASLMKIDVEGVKVNIVHQAVGAINEADITLANASSAIVVGFNVRPTPQARQQAEEDQVDIRLHNIIYNVIDEIETAMKGLLDPEYVEEVTGQAVVRETYSVSKLGTIAGSFVLDGFIERTSKVRLIRDNIVIYEGDLASLKRFKDDAKEVNKGLECGIMIEGYNDIKVDDIIEAYRMVEVERK
ncbi:translation initiation factor IF-2 [Facklamia miroungae]|uniref:Translation initiation factor IF-2 n=1 Tax=Facklamia miroungae TaxID=120956 RepID=A0A1G7P632_9LACT|nr:translation initiation factor IF-2 [Facklamia miroungae]NKZ28574.1 translation initiation factor IF-2 [Facklamia miroungae]SDF81059.1 translation initiation factor IF-2 [Facklamia miroungae]